jgi:hypothetical protein
VAEERDVFLREPKRGAGGDAQLLLHQVEPGDRLGDRVLDLQAGVHLDEVELAVLIEELDGAGAAILHFGHGVGAGLADLLALRLVQGGREGFFPDLLVAALQRTVALAQIDRIALAVAKHLDFDVAGRPRYARCRRRIVAERGLGLGRAWHSASSKVFVEGDLHAAPAAAGGRLDQHRIADLSGGDLAGFVLVETPPSEPGTTGMPSRLAVCLASILSPMMRMCSLTGR